MTANLLVMDVDWTVLHGMLCRSGQGLVPDQIIHGVVGSVDVDNVEHDVYVDHLKAFFGSLALGKFDGLQGRCRCHKRGGAQGRSEVGGLHG